MKKSHIKVLFSVILAISLSNCCRVDSTKMGLKATDRFYLQMSEKDGRNTAFIAMFDTTGVMMRDNGMPIQGISAIRAFMAQRADTSYTLKWEPIFADSSGNLGYTYGTWNLTARKSGEFLGEGTYSTIWKKNTKGEWKALLDTGNDGLKEK
jgi:ketosteroid isomerase-like protein